MNSIAEEILVLDASGFEIPQAQELPEGIVAIYDAWILPNECGLYDSNGAPIVESFLRRGPDLTHYPHGRPKSFSDLTKTTTCGEVLERIVYLPHAGMFHFGHLLSECAAYLGPLLEHPDGLDGIGGLGALLVVSPHSAHSCPRVAELLGVPKRRVISTTVLGRPVKCLKAVVPLPSMMNRHGVATRHFRHVRKLLALQYGCGDHPVFLGSKRDRGEKLYLSRSRLPSAARHTIAEQDLEANLSDLGWRIVFPEQLTLRDQLDFLADARTIAGCLGSAFHLLMAFGESVGNRRLITLGPTPDQSNTNIVLHTRIQHLPLRHIVCLGRESAENRNLRFLFPPAQIASQIDSLATDFSW